MWRLLFTTKQSGVDNLSKRKMRTNINVHILHGMYAVIYCRSNFIVAVTIDTMRWSVSLLLSSSSRSFAVSHSSFSCHYVCVCMYVYLYFHQWKFLHVGLTLKAFHINVCNYSIDSLPRIKIVFSKSAFVSRII